jgi:hypothetical protein
VIITGNLLLLYAGTLALLSMCCFWREKANIVSLQRDYELLPLEAYIGTFLNPIPILDLSRGDIRSFILGHDSMMTQG